MQGRRIKFIKATFEAVLEKNQKRPSIVFKVDPFITFKPPQRLKKDQPGYHRNDKFLSSQLCTNHSHAKLVNLVIYKENTKLYTMYPEQIVDLSNWLTFPYENSFPLYLNDCHQILSESNLHFLVEVYIETYGSSTTFAKLENYGLIMAWTVLGRHMSFILKTDINHITELMSELMRGQYYINNGLFITRVQSVLISGKPSVHRDIGHFGPLPDKDSFYALCEATEEIAFQSKTKTIARARSMSIQDKFTDDFLIEVKKHLDNKSNSAPATCVSSPAKNYTGLVKHLPEEVLSAITALSKSTDSSIVHLSNVAETKDNINDEKSRNINQSRSTEEIDIKNSILEEEEKTNKVVKPPNVLICGDAHSDTTNNLYNLLSKVLEKDRYVIHIFHKEDYEQCKVWMDDVSLVVLCGHVGAELGAHLIEYIVRGGKLLALCSDMLHILLPSFKTAEVRENEIVHFSYGKWKRVRMMHHIFCYHASPVRTRFSQDNEDTRASALNPPTSTSVKDKKGNVHSFDVQVLGREETWHSPSILLATLPSSGGKVIFSQIHLEIDPMQYEGDKYDKLKKSNTARLEIISDLLSTHLGLDVNRDTNQTSMEFTPGYFLGKFEMKMKMLEKLKNNLDENNVLLMSKIKIQFCANKENMQPPSSTFLPIMLHMCPPNFSTVEYFDNLYTKELGRLVVYTDVLVSSMNVVNTAIEHGLTVITRQQTNGQGRYSNQWLSPKGCAMFTLQVCISMTSNVGRYVSILQHVTAVALVSAVRSIKGYEDIDLRIKWPNDIYIGNSVKIGGIIVSSIIEGGKRFVNNIGAGINLSNNKPTTCINDVILQHNQKYNTKLQTLSFEKYLALVFNELEVLLDIMENGNKDHFYQLYYKYWLHTNANVTVKFVSGKKENVKILGIDDYGYLLVQGQKGKFTVHSDENSFDVLKGLIVPK